jgi:hypothetical protein
MNSYLVTFDYSYYSVSYLMNDNKGDFKLFAITYLAISCSSTVVDHTPPHPMFKGSSPPSVSEKMAKYIPLLDDSYLFT